MKTVYILLGLCTLICMSNATCEIGKALHCVQTFVRELGMEGTPLLCANLCLSNTSRCIAGVTESQACLSAYSAKPGFLKKFHDEKESQEEIKEACKRVDVFNKNMTCINIRYPSVVQQCITTGDNSAESKFQEQLKSVTPNNTDKIHSLTCGFFDDIGDCMAKGFDVCGTDMTEVGKKLFRALAPRQCDEGVFNTFSLLCLFLSFFAFRQAV